MTPKIPRCMSTQHPDNATLPFFAQNSVLSGDDEVQEAYYVFSHLGIEEQLWDSEGKDVDNSVVKKLLNNYGQFFHSKKLGKDFFLTLRVPNPTEEKNEAKILLETLESIPRSFDVAREFYCEDIAPIFEVVQPMTRNAAELERIYRYYTDFVVGKQHKKIVDMNISKWIGTFQPERINVIPLIEDKESLSNIKKIVGEFILGKRLEYQRVWLARSDPALNYGMLSAVLLNKVAAAQLDELQEESSLDIFPIIGVGSVPFRGNFSPDNTNCLKGYPSVQTFTTQSAFKYDHSYEDVQDAVSTINETKRRKAIPVDKNKCSEIIERVSHQYIKELQEIVPWIHKIAGFIPKRRNRKLHIGLFGYSRGVGEFSLPRAIGFCASLYSLGLPPELLGYSALKEKDFAFLEEGIYKNYFGDMRDALRYTNLKTMKMISPHLAGVAQKALKQLHIEIDTQHATLTDEIFEAIRMEKKTSIQEKILRAAWRRKFLG